MMKKYEFRESGTCINPDIAFDIKPLLSPLVKIECQIRVAQKNGVWNYGYNLTHPNGGACCGVFFNTEIRKKPFYVTKKAAVLAAFDELIGYTYCPKACLNVLKDARNTMMHEQLSLQF